MEKTDETLGQRLCRLRTAVGLTQDQVAERSGQSIWSIRNWENDRRRPQIDAIRDLAAALGATVDDLASAASRRPIRAEKRDAPELAGLKRLWERSGQEIRREFLAYVEAAGRKGKGQAQAEADTKAAKPQSAPKPKAKPRARRPPGSG
jgi:transcriptional regulator with XRE-family HTH domain